MSVSSFFFFFFFNDTATTEIYTLSLHDALPIFTSGTAIAEVETDKSNLEVEAYDDGILLKIVVPEDRKSTRLNSSHSQISYAVFCLKKKKKKYYQQTLIHQTTQYRQVLPLHNHQ